MILGVNRTRSKVEVQDLSNLRAVMSNLFSLCTIKHRMRGLLVFIRVATRKGGECAPPSALLYLSTLSSYKIGIRAVASS